MTTRLDRMLRALTGKERALIFLREYRVGKTDDAHGPSFNVAREDAEYWKLVKMIGAVNGEVGTLIYLLHAQIGEVSARLAYLYAMRALAVDRWLLGQYIELVVPTPLTRGQRRNGAINVVVCDREEAETLRKMRTVADRITAEGRLVKLPLDVDAVTEDETRMTAALVARAVRDGLADVWTQLKAAEVVIDECREAVGDDPLRPNLRELLDDTKQECLQAHAELQAFIGEWDLPDDHSAALALLREVMAAR
jgi:hypothetical protein